LVGVFCGFGEWAVSILTVGKHPRMQGFFNNNFHTVIDFRDSIHCPAFKLKRRAMGIAQKVNNCINILSSQSLGY
jgi:hypothetical protein